MSQTVPGAEAYVFASPQVAEEVARKLNELRMAKACDQPHFHHILIKTAGPVLCIVYTGHANIFVDALDFEAAVARTGHPHDILTKG